MRLEATQATLPARVLAADWEDETFPGMLSDAGWVTGEWSHFERMRPTEDAAYLGQDLLNHVAVNVGQAIVATLKAVVETLVVDTEAVKQCGMKIMHMDRVFGDVVAVVVCLAEAHSRFDSATRHPNGKAAWMVVTAKTLRIPLRVDGAAKLACPDHQGFVQHALLFEVCNQRSGTLVRLASEIW